MEREASQLVRSLRQFVRGRMSRCVADGIEHVCSDMGEAERLLGQARDAQADL